MAGECKEIERFKLDLFKINTKGIFKGLSHACAYGGAALLTWVFGMVEIKWLKELPLWDQFLRFLECFVWE